MISDGRMSGGGYIAPPPPRLSNEVGHLLRCMTAVTQLNAALADRYEIEREAGQGGMATVYLARDLRHDRKVALKVLHPDLAAALGAERFLAEIRTTANLQHPHILPLHDSGVADGFLFYVMPFVEGETLRARLVREQILPIDDAIRIAREILGALDYAHRHGVIHRDIKPENVLLHDGSALVADFGIALAVTAAAGQRMTQTGLSLGTPQYMSPEQAMGERQIDGRADVYATGAVLYEMLTGEPPFSGATVQAIVAKVLTERPTPPSTVRDTVPPHVEAGVLRALAKLPADRFASAAQFADFLASGSGEHGTAWRPAAAATPAKRVRAIVPWLIAAAAVGVTAWSLTRSSRETRAHVERYEIPLPVRDVPESGLSMMYIGATMAMSSDGSRLAYVARDSGGTSRVWVRSLAELEQRAVSGTERAASVTLAPDGSMVAFTVDLSLRKIPVDGGAPVTLVPEGASAPSWGDDGWIYYLASSGVAVQGKTINRVSARDGRIEKVYTDSARITDPVPVPGGKAILVRRATESKIVLATLPDGRAHEFGAATIARVVTPGFLVMLSSPGVVTATPFDLRRLETTGPPVPIAGGGSSSGDVINQFAVSSTGIVYVTGAERDNELVWVTRSGQAQPVDTTIHGRLSYPALSPDGTRFAVSIDDNVWIKQADHGPMFKLSLAGGNYAAWTHDGSAVSYFVNSSTGYQLTRKRSDGSGQPTRLMPNYGPIVESLWSPDGKWLVYRTSSVAKGEGDIYAVRASADTAPTALFATKFAEVQPAFSPDGRWLAYASNETGRHEVYVVPFPDVTGGRWAISTRGGTEPLWSPRGDELFYRDGNENLVAVSVKTTPTFSLGQSTILFSAAPYKKYPGHRMYDVARDGRRFLMVRDKAGEMKSKVVLMRHWVDVLSARVAKN